MNNLKQHVCAANREINRVRLAILTWGNASEVDREAGVFAIKPSGVAYEDLIPDRIPVISLQTGDQIGGDLNPSSDTATHWRLYRAFPSIGGIVHTHSPHATAWAQARMPIPCLGTTHADSFYGPVPCTRPLTEDEIESDYEGNTGKIIAAYFEEAELNPLEVPGALVSAHAPFTWGKNALDAVTNALILEEVARMATETRLLHPGGPEAEPYLVKKHYNRKHGPNATYGQCSPETPR